MSTVFWRSKFLSFSKFEPKNMDSLVVVVIAMASGQNAFPGVEDETIPALRGVSGVKGVVKSHWNDNTVLFKLKEKK